jgi:hypothetical protein
MKKTLYEHTETPNEKGVFLRTEYNYNTNKASKESGIDTGTETKVKASFKEECDINVIVRRFGVTGQLPNNIRTPTYGDFTNIPTFHEAMNACRGAEESFMKLRSDIRAKFGNDPGAFVEYCSDPENREQLKKWGLTEVTEEKVSPRPVTTREELVKPETTAKTGSETAP